MALEPQHWRYIQLRLLGATNPEAATELNIDDATAWRWGQIAEVREELARLQTDASESAMRRLRSALSRAAKRVLELTDSEDDNVALRACALILERMPEVADEFQPAREVASTGDPWGE